MSDNSNLKIFIASSNELEAEREKCISIVNELRKAHTHLNLEPVLYEYDIPDGNFPGKENIQAGINPALEACQITIFIFYSKIGKYTREEFELAIAQEKKIFAFFKKGFSPETMEEIEAYGNLLKFKKGLEDTLLYREYGTLSDFDNHIYKNLNLYLTQEESQEDKPEALVSSSKQLIPYAPRPYIAHPYSLAKNFTGRAKEMAELTNWIHLKKEPMLIVEAIGGMGKSALTWKWLHDEIINKDNEIEGVVWWSFYDEPFNAFVKHLFRYVFSEEERQQMGMVDELTELIRALHQRRFLIILDGFERVLRGYAQMMAMYIQEGGLSRGQIEEMYDKLQRDPVHPKATKFIRSLCVAQSKTLMTTRLFPSPLEDRTGIHHLRLMGLSDTDTIDFFKKEGIKGSADEMVEAGKVYHNHPLMLKLLSSAIRRSFTKNIGQAWNKNIIDLKEPQKILQTSFGLLNEEEKKVASAISIFRTAFRFDAVAALFPKMSENRLEEILYELYQLGFIFYQEQEAVFDFHPIMRSFLYKGMTRKASYHERAIVYFQAIPEKEKIVSLVDLEPVIEQYYHLVRAGKLDEAYEIYNGRLSIKLYYQLGEFALIIDLIGELFVLEKGIWRIENKSNQALILNKLANCLMQLGRLTEAKKYYLMTIKINEERSNFESFAMNLTYMAGTTQSYLGVQGAAILHFQRAKNLIERKEIENRIARIYGYLGRSLLYQGQLGLDSNKGATQLPLFNFLDKALEHYNKVGDDFGMSLVSFYYCIYYLRMTEVEQGEKTSLFQQAFKWGINALTLTETIRVNIHPYPQYYIQCYYAFGDMFLQFQKQQQALPEKQHSISFYDEHFQKTVEEISIERKHLFSLSERCLTEALTRSRKINMVTYEPGILLSFAKLEWLKIQDNQKDETHFSEVETHLQEAQDIAEKGPYRIYLAEIHLFCAETLIEIREQELSPPNQILDADAATHLKLAKDNALDQSTIEDVYQAEDPKFYDGIPEYAMLKRGLTKQERIEKGYYIAWQIAERLEQRLNSLS